MAAGGSLLCHGQRPLADRRAGRVAEAITTMRTRAGPRCQGDYYGGAGPPVKCDARRCDSWPSSGARIETGDARQGIRDLLDQQVELVAGLGERLGAVGGNARGGVDGGDVGGSARERGFDAREP